MENKQIETSDLYHINYKSALIVYQMFCSELYSVMKQNPNNIPKDVPEAVDILNAIVVLKRYYPDLNFFLE